MSDFQQKVLDHGFVKLRNIAGPTRRAFTNDALKRQAESPLMGILSDLDARAFDADDTDVANAARLSFEGQDQERTYAAEMKLAKYLLVNHHDTPFEAIVVWLEMKMPIFIARQLVRQRTQSINEASARYITLPAEWYIPEVVGGKPVNAKQGQQDNLPEALQATFKRQLDQTCAIGYGQYKAFIDAGVAPEHARMFLHVNHYTHWMTTMSLRNLFMSLLRLRWHSHAQIEAQACGEATFNLLEPHLPGLMALYREVVKETMA